MALQTVVLALLLLASSAATDASAKRHSLIPVSQDGIMHLDTSGELVAWRPEAFQWWQAWHVATNPHNGTICWVQAQEDQNENALLRCAPIATLNDTWDLPQPSHIRLNFMEALAFDWVNENWHLTASRVSYVCSYLFDRCVKLAEAGGTSRFYAAYDMPNRLLFRIANEKYGPYKLQVLNLDGTGLRELPVNITYPCGMAVDPVQKQIYILASRRNIGLDAEIYQVNYAGESERMIAALDERTATNFRRAIDVIDGDIYIMWKDQTTVSRVSASDGEVEDLVAGAVRGQALPAPAKVEKLLALRIVSPERQPEQVENVCEDAGCQHLCVPTAMNGTAGATCFCPEGQDLVELGCHKKYPAYAVVASADSLQAVDLQTEQVTEILSGLNNVTDLAFFRAGDEEYLLFWLDASGISRGSWSPGAVVSDSSIVVPAAENKHILSMAIDWEHQNLVWMEKDASVRFGESISFKVTPFDGAYVKTLLNKYWEHQSNLIITGNGQTFAFLLLDWGKWAFRAMTMDGKEFYGNFAGSTRTKLKFPPKAVIVKPPLDSDDWMESIFWVNVTTNSVESYGMTWRWSPFKLRTVLTHPSLKDVGGLAVLGSRLYWTEHSTGRLWTADSGTDGSARALPAKTSGGPMQVLHPWLQPAAAKPACDQQRNGCSHFCLTIRVGKCLCPDGLALGADEKTCE